MSQQPFVPANPLEESLQRAATNPGDRPAFYRLLLENDVFLLTPNPPEQAGRRTLQTNEQVSLVNWQGEGGNYVPMFTSLQRLQEAVNQVGATYGYLALNTKAAFQMLSQGHAPAFLNPGSPYGKEFLANEMRAMADGSFFQVAKTHVVEKPTQILIGQPSVYPTRLVEALKTLFSSQPAVSAAYLAQIHDPNSSDPPHIMIGIECPGQMRSIAPQAAMVAQEVIPGGGQIVDFIEVGNNGSFDDYFKKQTKPFYQRSDRKPRWKFW